MVHASRRGERRPAAEGLQEEYRRLRPLGFGAATGLAYALWKLFTAELPLVLVLVLSSLLAGIGLLFFVTLRARLRTLPYDAYRKVER